MRIRHAALAVLLATVCVPACSEPARPPLVQIPQVLLVEVSGIPDARGWAVRDQREWRSLWDSFPASEMAGRTLPVVDFARDMVVVVTAGNGSSGSPALSFAGSLVRGDTTEVHVRSQACGAADDVTQLLIAGRVPHREGPVRVIRHYSVRCDG